MHRRSFFALALAGLTGALAGFRGRRWRVWQGGHSEWYRCYPGVLVPSSDVTFPPPGEMVHVSPKGQSGKSITIELKLDNKAIKRKIIRAVNAGKKAGRIRV